MATAEEILHAQEAGAAAAQQAQHIADTAQAESFADYLFGGEFFHDVFNTGALATGANVGQAGAAAAPGLLPNSIKAAKDTADTVLNVVKWVGIAIIVVIGILAALWILTAFLGLRWAAGLLSSIAPTLAKNAKIVAHI